jgi:RNA recognition motif-containing protein
MKRRLCVWNLSPETTRDDLYSLFGQVSQVISIDFPPTASGADLSPDTSIGAPIDPSTAFGFIEIDTGDLAGVIDKVHITELNGRTVQVSESVPDLVAVHLVPAKGPVQGSGLAPEI